MGDVKTVKVDNWGSFFLQKLQNFFNKTDYCDLTLQFRDNSQLKVHRLVLSACTDYFNLLETTTNCQDDILIMPRDLQADVVVPIVNFMYTGTLEFEVRMYERLLRTARDMKMSVLLKLLEAHRRAIPQPKPPPVVLNRGVVGRPAMRGGGYTPASTRGRPMGSMNSRGAGDQLSLVSRIHAKSNRMDMSYESKPLMAQDDDDDEDEMAMAATSSDFERLRRSGNENPNKRPAAIQLRAASPLAKKPNLQDVKEYTEAALRRKQLNEGDDDAVTAAADYEVDDTYDHSSGDEAPPAANAPRQSMSLLAVGKNSAAKAQEATVVVAERPGQKIDHAKIIQEVMKKYPHLLKSSKNIKLKITQKSPSAQGTKFTVRAESAGGDSPTPTAAAKTTPAVSIVRPGAAAANSGSKATPPGPGQRVVLRAGSAAPPSKSIVLKSSVPNVTITKSPATPAPAGSSTGTPLMKGNRIDSRTMHRLIAMGAENTEGPWLCLKCGVDGKPIGIPSYKAFRKHLINSHQEKIDPRLCENCGHKSKNRNEMYYHMQTKHGITPPQGFQYPVCATCKFVALDKPALLAHEKEKSHGAQAAAVVVGAALSTRSRGAAAVAPPKSAVAKQEANDFSCDQCDKVFLTRKALLMHQIVKHRPKAKNRRRRRAADSEEEEEEEEDVDEEEEEEEEDDGVEADFAVNDDEEYVPKSLEQTKKINILSNVSLRTTKARSSEADSLATVATGIATSLAVGGAADDDGTVEYHEESYGGGGGGGEETETSYIEEAMASVHGEKPAETQLVTKFLAEDGSELELTEKQKEELMSQLEASANGGNQAEDVVMVYEPAAGGDDTVKEEIVGEGSSVLTDGDDVLMVYSGPKKSKAAAAAGEDKAKKKDEDLMAEEDEEEEVVEEEKGPSIEGIKVEEVLDDSKTEVDEEKVEDEKLKLLKELEGDWSEEKETEEEEEDDDEVAAAKAAEKVKKEDLTESIMKDWEKTDEEATEEDEAGDKTAAEEEEEDVKMELEEEPVVKTQPDEEAKTAEVVVEEEEQAKDAKGSKEAGKTATAAKEPESVAAFVHDWDDDEN